MSRFVHDDGRTESIIEFMPASVDCNWGYVFVPTGAPRRPMFSVSRGVFSEQYGLPRGTAIASGGGSYVDAEQFVNIRRKLRAQNAAEWQDCMKNEAEWRKFYDETDRWFRAETLRHEHCMAALKRTLNKPWPEQKPRPEPKPEPPPLSWLARLFGWAR